MNSTFKPLSPGGSAWMSELTRGEKGIHASLANVTLIIACDPVLTGLVAYDEFSHAITVTRVPPKAFEIAHEAAGPYPRTLNDNDIGQIQKKVQRVHAIRMSREIVEQAVALVADQVKIHPVRDYLNGLVWDGVPRVDSWLHTVFGVPDDLYHQAIGSKFLIACVRRIRQPGVKFDTMLVVEGDQNLGKSSCGRELFTSPLYSDDLPDISKRDAPISMLGMWCVEMSEMSSISKSDVEIVKAFLSRQFDHYREVHGKRFLKRPRQCQFLGTSNDRHYLRDTTGNRRFWPVAAIKAEWMWIRENRDQLWAEAAHREAEGETIYLDDEALQELAKLVQAERVAEDVWTTSVLDHLYNGSGGTLAHVRTADLLTHVLSVPKYMQNRAAEIRVSAILRIAGWRATVTKKDNRSVRVWVPKT